MTDRTLILITNDDGIESFGLHAAIVACAPLGDLLVVAPSSQQTAAGRSKPNASTGEIITVEIDADGVIVLGYG
ncbi:MAG: hypothetical protein KAX65_05700, partial [Caldilineaceae bacterium]|nr:hypothetical protein [Caldilineaceae bacterium]